MEHWRMVRNLTVHSKVGQCLIKVKFRNDEYCGKAQSRQNV